MNLESEQVLVSLRKIIRAIELQSRKIYAVSQITGPQLLILKSIEKGKDNYLTINDLTSITSLSQPTISSLVKTLVRKNLVTKSQDKEDKRRYFLSLSAKGKRALSKAPTLLQDSFLENFNSIPKWEAYMILSCLEKLACLMDAENIDADPILSTSPIKNDISQ